MSETLEQLEKLIADREKRKKMRIQFGIDPPERLGMFSLLVWIVVVSLGFNLMIAHWSFKEAPWVWIILIVSLVFLTVMRLLYPFAWEDEP